jgi:hypothetical protein
MVIMKIQPGSGNIINSINTGQGREAGRLEVGHAFWGRVVSIQDGSAQILTNMGSIKAQIAGENVSLPLNTSMVFKIVDSTKDTIVIKTMQQDVQINMSKEQLFMGLLDSLGIEPSPANVDFLKNGGFSFGKNIEKLITTLLMDNNENDAANLKNIMIRPSELGQYIKGFESGDRFLSIIDMMLKAAAGDRTNPKLYEGLAANVLKGLSIQINHDFPLFFIPVPMYFENEPHHGEIWLEKGSKGNDSEDIVYIHILMDTPHFGRIEGDIRNLNSEIILDIYCIKDTMPVFEKYLDDLKSRIVNLGYNVMGLNLHELTKPRNFTDFAKNYVKPFIPLDIKV